IRYDDIGKLRAQLEALKRQLETEGAFRPERKRPLPLLPRAIALVTSPTGAVIHDLQETILERYPNSEILVYPAQVQGLASPTSVVTALEQCNREARAEVVVVARGGGSFEELYAFNSEVVARAILNSRIPVVTALGHTSDRTLADLVGDCECRTPTAAGERVVPRKSDLLAQLQERQRRLRRELNHLWSAQRERLESRQQRLGQQLPLLLKQRLDRLIRCRAQVANLNPRRQLEQRQELLKERELRLRRALELRLGRAEERLGLRGQRLQALSPHAVLARGYSITSDATSGAVLRDAQATNRGQRVKIRLAVGQLQAQIEENGENDG
ncbi:MAG: exodeoxyribonuclease VII large subunit, partial [Candidatus Dormibacteraceae bacterium]